MPRLKHSIPAELPEAEQLDLTQLAQDYAAGKVDLIVVLGPTASGKTRYAVALAEEICAAAALGLFEGCPARMTDDPGITGAEIISEGNVYSYDNTVGNFTAKSMDREEAGGAGTVVQAAKLIISATVSVTFIAE